MKLRSRKQKIGKKGEMAVSLFLKSRGYDILAENYSIPLIGEIDIVAKKDKKIHFIEVKSIRLKNSQKPIVSDETYNPAENFHREKYLRVYKTAQLFLQRESVSYETFQIDLYLVFIDEKKSKFYIKRVENVVVS